MCCLRMPTFAMLISVVMLPVRLIKRLAHVRPRRIPWRGLLRLFSPRNLHMQLAKPWHWLRQRRVKQRLGQRQLVMRQRAKRLCARRCPINTQNGHRAGSQCGGLYLMVLKSDILTG